MLNACKCSQLTFLYYSSGISALGVLLFFCPPQVVRKHYPDGRFGCFFRIKSCGLKAVLRGELKSVYILSHSRSESTKRHKSPLLDEGMLQYVLVSNTETVTFMPVWVSPFSSNAECDLVNANNQLSAFVIHQQRHLAIVFPSWFCPTHPKQMDVCTVLTVCTVICVETETITHSLFFLGCFLGGCCHSLCTGNTGWKCLPWADVGLCWFMLVFVTASDRSHASACSFVRSVCALPVCSTGQSPLCGRTVWIVNMQ